MFQDGKEAGFVNKITEWHSKLGEMRLKEIQQQRAISRLEEKTRHLSEQVMTRDKDVSILEQKLVQADKVIVYLTICTCTVYDTGYLQYLMRRLLNKNTKEHLSDSYRDIINVQNFYLCNQDTVSFP